MDFLLLLSIERRSDMGIQTVPAACRAWNGRRIIFFSLMINIPRKFILLSRHALFHYGICRRCTPRRRRSSALPPFVAASISRREKFFHTSFLGFQCPSNPWDDRFPAMFFFRKDGAINCMHWLFR